MRKNRNGYKRDIIIDLTSLLDVIFILLLVVLCGQSGIREGLEQSNAEYEHARAQAEANHQLYEDQLEIADHLDKYVWAVSVVVPYDEKEITQRQIKLLKEGGEIESFDLVGNEVTGSAKAFKESLTDYIRKYKDRPVILSLNEEDDRILYRDEVMVNEIFVELSKEYTNVYIKGNINEEE